MLVHWMDSCSPSRKWSAPAIMGEYEPAPCVSVGRVGRFDDTAVVIAASWAPEEVGDLTAIPTACIKRVKVLRRARKMGDMPK